MDIVFNCPECRQELEVEETGAGSQIDCPSCGATITIPEPSPRNMRAVPAGGLPGGVSTTTAAPATDTPGATVARGKHLRVPVGKKSAAKIEPPKPMLETQAKGLDKKLRVKTMRNGDYANHGPGAFDAAVTEFLSKLEEHALVSVTPIQYMHPNGNTSTYIQDYGVMILYRG